MEQNQKAMKLVYTVVDRGNGKSYWTRIGVGFENRDGSLNLRLDAIPTNGTIQVRNWEADARGEAPAANPTPVVRRQGEPASFA